MGQSIQVIRVFALAAVFSSGLVQSESAKAATATGTTIVAPTVQSTQEAAQQPAPAATAANTQVPSAPAMNPLPVPVVNVVPVKTIYVAENQPVQIIDSQGRVLEIIYLKRK